MLRHLSHLVLVQSGFLSEVLNFCPRTFFPQENQEISDLTYERPIHFAFCSRFPFSCDFICIPFDLCENDEQIKLKSVHSWR